MVRPGVICESQGSDAGDLRHSGTPVSEVVKRRVRLKRANRVLIWAPLPCLGGPLPVASEHAVKIECLKEPSSECVHE